VAFGVFFQCNQRYGLRLRRCVQVATFGFNAYKKGEAAVPSTSSPCCNCGISGSRKSRWPCVQTSDLPEDCAALTVRRKHHDGEHG
jgi:hypothetical protein